MRIVLSAFVVIVVLAAVVGLVYGVAIRPAIVHQPIAFNHAVHIDSAGMQCAECHTRAAQHAEAGIPGKNACFDCHDIDEEEGTHPEKTKLFAFDERDEDIPWQRVAVTKPDVYFSHRRHVTSAKLDCLECHPRQPALTAPPSTASQVMSMTECMDCHESSGVSVDCLRCHR